MKHQINQILNRHIVADHVVVRLVQILLFVGGISVLALTLWKLSRMELTSEQMFFGVLLSPVTPLLFIVLGILMPMAVAPKNVK